MFLRMIWTVNAKLKKVTVGVYDTQEEAIINGNKTLEKFEKYFPLNPHYNKKERFSKNGGCFGSFKNLVTELSWIETPFDLYANIEILDYKDVDETIKSVMEAEKRYKEYKINN